jgi:hypothetical protein
MTAKQIGEKLVELCRAGQNHECLSFYSPKAVSIEPMGSDEMPAVMEGVEKIRGKGEWWVANNDVHKAEVKGPFPNGDRFAVIFDYEFTPKVGPMKGKRTQMEEVGLYTVEGGKIVREEFYYAMG